MKTIIALTLLMTSVSAFSQRQYSQLNDVREDMCEGIEINYEKDTAVCTGASNIKEVLSAKVGDKIPAAEATYQKLGFHTYGAIDIGVVPDADTNGMFHYLRWLVNPAGKKVGVIVIAGWENYQMERRGRVDARYNMKGEIVWLAIKDF